MNQKRIINRKIHLLFPPKNADGILLLDDPLAHAAKVSNEGILRNYLTHYPRTTEYRAHRL
jgi:hypothetical protein